MFGEINKIVRNSFASRLCALPSPAFTKIMAATAAGEGCNFIDGAAKVNVVAMA